MKKILIYTAMLFLTTGMIFAQTPNLFFSEYIEGSSNNKALEIYNAGSTTVNLTDYNILTNYNGNPWSGMYIFPDGATLAPGDVWVIANSSADSTILAVADDVMAYNDSGYIVGFNGDDVRALVQIVGTDTTIIDIIGAYDGVDPGSGWDVAGITGATKDHTLVRKTSVTTGQTDWAVSAGTASSNSEWEVYPQDTFQYLGTYPPQTIPNLYFSEYIEGSSNNKALEIYNASDNTVDLTQFIIRNSHNADGWSSVHAFPAGATIASHGVWVMVANQVSSALFDTTKANEVIPYSSDSPVHFTGDDARALAFVNGTDTTNIDVIGDETTDPGTAWNVGDTTNATTNHTLIRKETVTTGTTDWTVSAGTNDASSEWVVYPQNTFQYLGTYPIGSGQSSLPVVQSVDRNVLVPTADQTTDVTAIAFADNGLASVNLVYSIDGINLTNVIMTGSSADSTYTGSIPASAYSDGTFLGYMVIATDNSSQSDTTDVYGFFAGTSPIDSVRHMAEPDTSDKFVFVSIAAKVKGICTAGSNNFSTGRIEAYLQDSTAAIKIYKYGIDTPEMVEGNSYTVTGTTDTYHGQYELVPQTLPDDIVDNGVSTVPDAKVLTINELLNDSERYESMLITINDATLSDATPWAFSSSSGATFYISDGSTADSLALRIDGDTDIYNAAEPTWPENITGLVAQYDAHQLLPRRLTDFDPATGVSNETSLPKFYTLDQNYPNPFNPTTTIKFGLPQSGFVTLKVYDMLGREIKTLVNKEMQASFQTIEFDASSLASGVYVYRLKVNNFISAKKLLLLK